MSRLASGGAGVLLTHDERLMHADEFGRDVLAREALAILQMVGEVEGFYIPETTFSPFVKLTSGDKTNLGIFLANKKRLINGFIDLLAKAYLLTIADVSKRTHQHTLINAQLSSDHEADTTCFSITCLEGSAGFYKIKVPFTGDKILREIPTDLRGLTPIQLYREGEQAVLVVYNDKLKAVFAQLEAAINSQSMAQKAVGYLPKVTVSVGRLHLEEHHYKAIFSGESGIAYRGEGVVGFFSSLFSSMLEEKPKNNLEKVIRLLENYKNPLKALGRHHFAEIDEIIASLQKLTPFYATNRPTEVDGLIVSRLVNCYDKWEAEHEAGSALRRIVFVMEELLPGIQQILDERSRSVATADSVGAGAGVAAPAPGYAAHPYASPVAAATATADGAPGGEPPNPFA